MELLFLGTGSGVPAKHRNVSSIALKLLEERNSIWLFDCGEATQHQILHTTIKPRKVEKIFITHMHGDHIFGLPGFLSSRAFQGGDSPVTVYGPKGIKQFVLTSLRLSKTYTKYPLRFKEFDAGEILFEDDQFIVETLPLQHGVPSYGFRIKEKDREGVLMADKLKELGVPFGPLFGRLKNGETVTLEDGRVIDGQQFIGPPQKGRVVTILGDTMKHKNSVVLGKDADVLVHESTFKKSEALLAKQYNHSTNIDAAKTAKEAKAKKLLLTHISARYLHADIRQLEKEAREIFPQTDVMQDFKEVTIPMKRAETKDE